MTRLITMTLNPAVDKSCHVDQVVPERKLRCRDVRYDPGGGGLNVARAVKELGGEVVAYWMGGGPTANLLSDLLDEIGLNHERLPIQALTRENLIAYEESSGQQFRFGMPGAVPTATEIESVLYQFQAIDPPPDYCVLSGSLPPGVDEDLYAQISRSLPSSCRVILDTSGRSLQRGLESPVFLIKPNIGELGELSDEPIESDEQIHEVAGKLIAEGKTQVVVTSLGSGGVALTTSDLREHIRAPTVKIRSKVGAGDSTVAGIVLGLSQGKDLSDAVRFGVAAGSAAVMTDGTELCHRKDTEQLFRQMS